MSDDDEEGGSEWWWWAAADGSLKTVERGELEENIRSGRLPARTLVWREGWEGWLHATQVVQLRGALPPGTEEPIVAPQLRPASVNPPPAPVHRYAPGEAARAQGPIAALPVIPAATTQAAGTPAPPAAVAPRPPSARPPAPRPMAGLLRTQVGLQPPKFPDTQPPAAVAEKPAGVTEKPAPAMSPKATVIGLQPPVLPKLPGPPNLTSLLGPPPAAPRTPPPPAPRTGPPPPLNLAAPPAPGPTFPLQSEAPPGAGAPAGLPALPPPPPPTFPPPPVAAPSSAPAAPGWNQSVPPAPWSSPPMPGSRRSSGDSLADAEAAGVARRSPRGLLIAAGIVAVGLFVIGSSLAAWKLIAGRGASAAPGSASAAPAAPVVARGAVSAAAAAQPAAASPANGVCRVTKAAVSLVPSVVAAAPFSLAAAPGGERIAFGWIENGTAVGATLDPKSLELRRELSDAKVRKPRAVVPLIASGTLSFAVDRDDDLLEPRRSVDAQPVFGIGMSGDGFSRVTGKRTLSMLWPGKGVRITDPRVGSVSGVGHAVTFRRSGADGTAVVGWLSPTGERKTDLADVKLKAVQVGTPTLGVGASEILLALAVRASADAHWSLMLARAAHGELPGEARAFELPAGGPGIEAISPSVAALPSGHWLLQWTEGEEGKREVRVVALDAKLEPVGASVRTSPEGQSAGQGAAFAVGGDGVSLFLVKSGERYELWASGISC